MGPLMTEIIWSKQDLLFLRTNLRPLDVLPSAGRATGTPT
jgi:hypothetical protein